MGSSFAGLRYLEVRCRSERGQKRGFTGAIKLERLPPLRKITSRLHCACAGCSKEPEAFVAAAALCFDRGEFNFMAARAKRDDPTNVFGLQNGLRCALIYVALFRPPFVSCSGDGVFSRLLLLILLRFCLPSGLSRFYFNGCIARGCASLMQFDCSAVNDRLRRTDGWTGWVLERVCARATLLPFRIGFVNLRRGSRDGINQEVDVGVG